MSLELAPVRETDAQRIVRLERELAYYRGRSDAQQARQGGQLSRIWVRLSAWLAYRETPKPALFYADGRPIPLPILAAAQDRRRRQTFWARVRWLLKWVLFVWLCLMAFGIVASFVCGRRSRED